MVPSILLTFIGATIFSNGVYFLGYQGNYPECGTICLVFMNLACVLLLLPLCFRSVKNSRYLKGGERLLTVYYLIAELLCAFLLLHFEAKPSTAAVWQFILLGLFLAFFFSIATADKNTDKKLKEFSAQKSMDLINARITLQNALATTTDFSQREYIRSALSDIVSSPIQTKGYTEHIEHQIYQKSVEMSATPSKALCDEIKSYVVQRKNIISINNSIN